MFATPAHAQAAGAAPSAGRVLATLAVLALSLASPAYAQAGGGAAQDTGPFGGMLPTIAILVLFFAMMYFTMIRPQQKRQKEHMAMVKALKRGDTVVLSNGMVGKVTRVEEDEAMVEIASGVNTRVIKTMITEVRTRGEPAATTTSKS
jgi:preprotein translocase subunit YajC